MIPNERVVTWACRDGMELIGNFAVTDAEKLAKLSRVPVGVLAGVPVIGELSVLRIINTLFKVHEKIGILADFILCARWFCR